MASNDNVLDFGLFWFPELSCLNVIDCIYILLQFECEV